MVRFTYVSQENATAGVWRLKICQATDKNIFILLISTKMDSKIAIWQ